jgi:hypothetical protein
VYVQRGLLRGLNSKNVENLSLQAQFCPSQFCIFTFPIV